MFVGEIVECRSIRSGEVRHDQHGPHFLERTQIVGQLRRFIHVEPQPGHAGVEFDGNRQRLRPSRQMALRKDPLKAFPAMDQLHETYPEVGKGNLGVGSTIFAVKPGDGSAREQAASCQKVLGGWANIATEYATKRYRSNLINWGMLPFLTEEDHEALSFKNGDYIFVPNVRKAVEEKADVIKAYVVGDELKELNLKLGDLTDAEREIILDGCLINYYRNH